MKKIMITALFFAMMGLATKSFAGAAHLKGKISNITSVKNGLLIMLDTGVPENCEGASYNWIQVKQENTAMISVVLMLWTTDKKTVTVYTDPRGTSGYCVANQIDPA